MCFEATCAELFCIETIRAELFCIETIRSELSLRRTILDRPRRWHQITATIPGRHKNDKIKDQFQICYTTVIFLRKYIFSTGWAASLFSDRKKKMGAPTAKSATSTSSLNHSSSNASFKHGNQKGSRRVV